MNNQIYFNRDVCILPSPPLFERPTQTQCAEIAKQMGRTFTDKDLINDKGWVSGCLFSNDNGRVTYNTLSGATGELGMPVCIDSNYEPTSNSKTGFIITIIALVLIILI